MSEVVVKKPTKTFERYWSRVELPITLEPYEYNMLKRYAYNAWKAGKRQAAIDATREG